MQFNVPQFLNIEDKVIGPFTLKQFGYLAGAGGVIFLIYTAVPNLFLFILLSIPVFTFAVALAFLKINGRPFINIIISFIIYTGKPKLFIWRKK
ncbi:MAG: hypothetical protein A2Y98_01355 [Candidatus Portnoybacteria bacterium RBG_19FT_COMBO_36_7]|uniref:PrgI family protein n=1 Tax=Candidatus Portnoybacteria bacterium RBG_19FT_COMBO_36_7 TaxID=1801992 RepID=A0A1G2F664_9BACT|nr:MAG: hypothetical protein A2Y98_01355 [Candidatus Portnoybacteria bacterium RBG_19FT_COMBO_36_7]